MISFMIFDAATLQEAFKNILGLFGVGTSNIISAESVYYLKNYLLTYVVAIVGATPLPKKIYAMVQKSSRGNKITTVAEPLIMALLFVIITAFLVDGSFNPFLYFRF